MTDNIVHLSSARHKDKRVGPRDVRRVGMPDKQPPARTRPGECWYLNGYDLSQVIVVRPQSDNSWRTSEDHHMVIGRFETIRDAQLATNSRNAYALVAEAYEQARSAEDFFDRVGEILLSFGRP